MKKLTKGKLNKPLTLLLTVLFWLAVWQLVSMLVDKDYVVPSVIETGAALGRLALTADFWASVGITLLRVAVGIAVSFILGGISAVLAYRVKPARVLLSGITAIFKATPVVSVIMFCLLFIISGTVPVIVCVLMCFPIFYTNILAGLDNVPSEYTEVASIYTNSTIRRMHYVMLPLSKPYIKASLELGCGIAWKSVVAAEVLSSPKISMGYHLLLAKNYLEAAELFAWTIAIIVASVIFTAVVKWVVEKVLNQT